MEAVKWDGPKDQERLLVWFAELSKFAHSVVYDIQLSKNLPSKWIVSLLSRLTARS